MVDLINNEWGRKFGEEILSQGTTIEDLRRPDNLTNFLNLAVERLRGAFPEIRNSSIFTRNQQSVRNLAEKL